MKNPINVICFILLLAATAKAAPISVLVHDITNPDEPQKHEINADDQDTLNAVKTRTRAVLGLPLGTELTFYIHHLKVPLERDDSLKEIRIRAAEVNQLEKYRSGRLVLDFVQSNQ